MSLTSLEIYEFPYGKTDATNLLKEAGISNSSLLDYFDETKGKFFIKINKIMELSGLGASFK